MPNPSNDAELKTQLLELYFKDRVAFCRDILPHWFPKPMPWFHRGILAILVKNADFLLHFGEETWEDGTCRWTKKGLAKIVKHFQYPVDPTDENSPMAPIFKVRYAGDGRTPVAIDMVLGQYTNLIIPRGFSKTTLVNAAVLSQVLYEETKFTVYIGHAQHHADTQLQNVAGELEANEKVIALWGNLVPDRQSSTKWTQSEIETSTGVTVMSKGRGSQIRGLNKGGNRPDHEIEDDIEDEDSVLTETQRDKTLTWHKAGVEPSLKKIGTPGRMTSLGTILHPDCLVMKLAKDPRYTTVKFGATLQDADGNLEPLWSERMSLKDIEKERTSFARAGKLFQFGMEYESTIRLEDKVKFKAANVQQYKFLTPEEFQSQFVARALCVDPAISEDSKADYCAFGVVGISPEKGRFHVAEVFMKRGMPASEVYEKYFELSLRWGTNRHGVEGVAYQKSLVHGLREQMFRRGHYFEIDEKVGGRMTGTMKNKFVRVEGIIQPRYAAGLVTHNQRWPEYESQLLDWPHGKKDGPDVIAMCFALLDPYAGLALDNPDAIMADVTMEELEPDMGQWAP